MCNENYNLIKEIDFSTTNDEMNWFNNSNNPIATENGMLVFRADSQLSVFSRGIGTIDITNNRLKYLLNLEINRPLNGVDTVYYIVQFWNGTNLIGESTIYITNIAPGQIVKYSLERTYKYDQLSGNISIKIKTPIGFENEIKLKNLKVQDFNYCEEKVRTYFLFEEFFENSKMAQSAGLKLNSWKENNIETLTTDFHSYNAVNLGGNPITDWKFATAEPDGSNRISAANNQNTFNPFVYEFGLIFDDVNSFYGGKVLGTISNQNFGAGVLKLGIDKPEILNANLQRKKGAFFIDIDYTKNLKIEIDVIVNQTNSQLYTNPTSYRKYFIVWDSEKCQREFYYLDMLDSNTTSQEQIQNGFLSGITPEIKNDVNVSCGETIHFEGVPGVYSYNIDFGTATGICGIQFNNGHFPNKYDIIWNGQTFSSGFVGCNEYDTQLINAGIPTTQINTTSHPGNGTGQLTFNKTLASPNIATIIVTSVMGDDGFDFDIICPQPENIIQITWSDSFTNELRSDVSSTDIDVDLHKQVLSFSNTTLQLAKWQKLTSTGWADIINLTTDDQTVTVLKGFINKFRLYAEAVDSTVITSNELVYELYDEANPGGGGGCPTLDMEISTGVLRYKKVSDLKVNDLIYTKHEKNKTYGFYPITSLKKSLQPVLKITLENGKEIKVSDSHKFENEKGNYVSVKDFKENDYLLELNDKVRIDKIESLGKNIVMHIEVEEAHTYMIKDIHSHNKLQFPDDGPIIINP